MLSIGIQFGEGFDKPSILKLLQMPPEEWDYDLLVLGTSPGGIACAREASLAGKRAAVVKWRKNVQMEEEIYEAELSETAQALEDDFSELSQTRITKRLKSSVPTILNSSKVHIGILKSSSKKSLRNDLWWQKVRANKLDLVNELFKRGRQARKLMLKAAKLRNSVRDATNFGWRAPLLVDSLTLNWKKMSDLVTDNIMKENWILVNKLAEEGVEIIEGRPSFIDAHTIRILQHESKECVVSANFICTAPSADYKIPRSIHGGAEFGITCDDFIRLSEAPGKTLIVGSTPEGLECAGIVACFGLPVVVVSRSELLEGHDKEMSEIVLNHLKDMGVSFLKRTTLVSINLTRKGKLLTNFVSEELVEDNPTLVKEEEFDTVVFAIGKQTNLDLLNLKNADIKFDSVENKIPTNDQDQTSIPNIYAIGDVVAYRFQNLETSETAGKLLGKRLFRNDTKIMDYSMIPYAIITPLEYAFVGLTEEIALFRFGKECIEIFQGTFTPLETVLSSEEHLCLIKVIVFKPKNLVVGLHMCGPETAEVIQGFAVAMRLGMTMNQLQTFVGISATGVQGMTSLKERENEKKNENE